jgi:hypothetical protein
MRIMNLPELSALPNSVDECIEIYLERLRTGDASSPQLSLLLTAYISWPDDEERRNGFIATHLARGHRSVENVGNGATDCRAGVSLEMFGGVDAIANVAFDRLTDEISQIQRKWLLVADIFQSTVDMAHDERAVLRGGPSISKAIDLCECEQGLPGHSQLRGAWSEFRDVAHVLAASAYLAHEAVTTGIAADGGSVLNAIWIAPDAVLALAHGFQEFGLDAKAIQGESTILNSEQLWRISDDYKPLRNFIIYRRLSEAQLTILSTRRAAKKYIPSSVGAFR